MKVYISASLISMDWLDYYINAMIRSEAGHNRCDRLNYVVLPTNYCLMRNYCPLFMRKGVQIHDKTGSFIIPIR